MVDKYSNGDLNNFMVVFYYSNYNGIPYLARNNQDRTTRNPKS